MGAVTVITSGKGGVGKSTTTAHMGLALAARGRRVLLLDCDAGLGCLDMLLGVSQRRVFDLSDVVAGTTSPAKAIYQSPFMPGLFLIPAPLHEEDLVSTGVMRQLVPALARHYDHILIDCPAGVGAGFRSACAAADRAVVVSTPDGVSAAAAAKVRGQLLEQGIREQRLVINRFSPECFRRAHFFSDLDAVIDATGIQLIAVIPEDPALQATAAKELPPKNSPAAMAFARLALRLEGRDVPLPSLQKL
ncbi:MAG: P-loop NTPase [Oscillospiraceae bacterium]|jgi:septum site-determining protein MinD|nr:P-loop NTPase [Oscillospiraceae bacterium]